MSFVLLWAVALHSEAVPPPKKSPVKQSAVKKTSPSKSYQSKTYTTTKKPATKQAAIPQTHPRPRPVTNTKQTRRYVGKRTKNWVPPNHFTRIGQQKPTNERITEIERALAQRGYLHSEPKGVFDDHTAEALKRFQQDQNLKADGKLNALSLIALGLGPKRMGPPPATNPRLPPGGLSAISPVPPLPAVIPATAATEQKDDK